MASYNLGTALVDLGNAEEAELHLRHAADGAQLDTRQRAMYNLGHLYLTRALESSDPSALIPLLTEAIASNRVALLLDPGDEDARWNLALAQRTLDSLGAASGEILAETEEQDIEDVGETQETETSSETAEATEGPKPDEADPRETRSSSSDNSQPPEGGTGSAAEAAVAADAASNSNPGDQRAAEFRGTLRPPTQGAREAQAGQDQGSITEAAAISIIEAISDEPERLIQGLLWSQRPDVEWWAGEAFPGGSW
jgi:hypothetical protein